MNWLKKYSPPTSLAAAKKRRNVTLLDADEGRKRLLLIAASILASRKLAPYEGGMRTPATVSAVADAIRWAEYIMNEIDKRWPTK